MIEQATRPGDEDAETGSHMDRQATGAGDALNADGGAKAPEGRITADSFRMLMAKLKKPVVAPPAPVIAAPVIVEPQAVEIAPEVFAEIASVEEPVAEIIEAPAFVEVAVEPDVEVPEVVAFEEATPDVEPEPFIPEPEAVFPEPLPEIPVDEVVVAAAPEVLEPIAAIAPESPGKTAKEVEGIGDVAKAIYMTPTQADRALFLAECAAMAAAEAQAEKARVEAAAILDAEKYPTLNPPQREIDPRDDPFAKVSIDDVTPMVHTEMHKQDDAGDLARSLLDMMLSSPAAGLPQERALAADALLKLVPRIPPRALVSIVERVSIMESPPHLLVSKLINDPRIEVAGRLLEHCNHISDQVLSKVVETGQVSLQRLIARRRHISAALSDQLIAFDDPSVILTLVRNNGVTFSHAAYSMIAEHAVRHPAALAPFATRADLPPPIAFELYWFVPPELRRYLLSRFLTDSETLTKILKITQTMQGSDGAGEVKFPEREQIEEAVTLLVNGKLPEAAEKLGEIANLQAETAVRIMADREGEPLTIIFKALGMNRARFTEIIELLKNSDFGIIRSDRPSEELQYVFDSMSFNKARILLTYWDWATAKTGPYAPAN